MNNKSFITIHGIRKFGPHPTHMRPINESLLSSNLRTIPVNYGYTLLPITNKRSVSKAIPVLENELERGRDITLIGYSNGAWTALQLAEMAYPIQRLVLISPALHSAHAFPQIPSLERVDVFYCPTDNIGDLAKTWRGVTRVMPWRWFSPHPYGRMMKTGYVGEDERVFNHRLGDHVGHAFYNHADAVSHITEVIKYETPY